MLMIMSRLSSLAYKLLMLIFMLMLASLVKTGLKSYLDRSFSPAKGYDEHRSLPFYMSPLGEQSVVLERCTCYTGSRQEAGIIPLITPLMISIVLQIITDPSTCFSGASKSINSYICISIAYCPRHRTQRPMQNSQCKSSFSWDISQGVFRGHETQMINSDQSF